MILNKNNKIFNNESSEYIKKIYHKTKCNYNTIHNSENLNDLFVFKTIEYEFINFNHD